MALRAIWAQARSGAIGAHGGMPWHLPEDLAHFKRATLGSPVVMGRRTWESFPSRFRPLPGRRNIVITHDAAYDAPGAALAPSLEAALALAGRESDDPWIIGGATVYAEAMPILDELWVTEIDLDVTGDAFAPAIGGEWRLADEGEWRVSSGGVRYRFLVHRRAEEGRPEARAGAAGG